MSQRSDPSDPVRRRLLKVLGAASLPVATAGCRTAGDETPAAGTGTDAAEYTEGGTLRGSLGSNPSSFDPPYSRGTPSSSVQSFFYEGLLTTDARGNTYPWIAESYELVDSQAVGPADYTDYMVEVEYTTDDDGNVFPDTDKQIAVRSPENPAAPSAGDTGMFLTVDEAGDAVEDGTYGMQYQFTLHEGVTFTNGEEVTAGTVVDSYRRYENSQMSAQVWLNFLYAEKVDDYTVNLYAQKPSAEALRTLVWVLLPADHVDLPGGDLDPRQGTDPVGTGPWVFEEFADAEYLRVRRNDDYWLRDVGIRNKEWFDGPSDFPNTPAIEAVDISIIEDNATRAGALQNGEIDVARGLNALQNTNYDDADGFDVVSTETGGYLFFQYSVTVEPWDDKRVRQAANHLIPREQIVENIEQGWTRPAWTPLPELAYGSGTTDPESLEADLKPKNRYDPQRATELIERADVETPIETTIETNSGNDNRVQKAQLIAEAMNDTGLFDVQVETFEFGSLQERVFSEDYPEKNTILLINLSGTFDPGSFCETTHHSRYVGQCCNVQGVSFDDLDRMMDDAKFGSEVLDDTGERSSRYDEVWRRIVELSANSYVDIDQTVAVTNDEVKNWATYPFPEALYSYATFAPADGQVAYIQRE